MQYNEFIGKVQQQAHLASPDEAVRIARAVLETLGERLNHNVRENVAAQLPKELKDMLDARKNNTDVYGYTEFYNRVGARAGLTYEDAAERTWQVIRALSEAIPHSEVQAMINSLPQDFGQLFGQQIPDRARPKP